MLESIVGRSGSWLVAHADDPVSASHERAFAAAIERRSQGEPVAYIVGEAGFYGRRFRVTPDVLVPRPESENLIEAIVAECRALDRPARILDVGTGSGALAVTLACELREASVVATDISDAALAVARENAERHHVASRITFLSGDLVEPASERGPFDVIVANLPYVPTRDVPQAPDPVSFEPRVAVDGGLDGLDLYRRMLAQLKRIARPGMVLALEAAPPTMEALAHLVEVALPSAHLEIGEDLAGCERFILASL